MEQLAEYILNNNKYNNKYRNFIVPLDIKVKINDVYEIVKVKFIIHLNFTYTPAHWYFELQDKTLHCKGGDFITLYRISHNCPMTSCSVNNEISLTDSTKLATLLKWCYELIDTLVFDNEEGKFVNNDDIIVKQLSKIAFNADDKKFTTSNECCVCLNETKTKFCCNHHICYCCASKLNRKLCPMCRHNCSTFIYEEDNYIDCDEDEDA
jgi:hypothetical protein